MIPLTEEGMQQSVEIVGSSKFGRYDIISAEKTVNMFISDGWLVNFSGYQPALSIVGSPAEGRGLFHSVRGNFFLSVIAGGVYKSETIAGPGQFIGALTTTSGAVFFDENLSSQIGIVDGTALWIYNYEIGGNIGQPPEVAAMIAGGSLLPNYITYQNTHFVIGNGLTTPEGSQWYVFEPTAPLVTGHELHLVSTLTLQTKPDYARAALRIPGKGNSIIIFGSTVAEIWQDIGTQEVYRRNSSVNIDYGAVSVATIAASDEYVVWLGVNEKSSPSIMVMTGGGAERLSTDGIDFLLASIIIPSDSTAMFYRQDGHLFYILTFFNSIDNLTITYDFTTKKFFNLTDYTGDYFPARQVMYFQGFNYFISQKDGDIYEFGTNVTVYSTNASLVYEIPRIRICNTFRFPGPEKFLVNNLTFTIESGTEPGANFAEECVGYLITEDTEIPIITEEGFPILSEGGYCGIYQPRIDVTISKNNGRTFSNAVPYYMHQTGNYQNQPRFNRLGACNTITVQLRFWGFWRFIASNGIIEVRQ